MVAIVSEAFVDGPGGRELGHGKSDMAQLTRVEQAQLRSFANREWAERKEAADREGAAFDKIMTQ